MGLRPASMGIPAPGPEEQKRPPGSAGRPIARPRLFLVFQGLRDPWQAGFVRTNPMLAETKTRRCIRSRPPRRSHANPQSSAHLQLPSSCLADAADPATWRAYGLPGRGKQTTRPRGDKSGPAGSARQTRDRPPAPGGPGTHWRNTAARGPQTAPVMPRPAPATWRACGLPGRGEAPRARRTKAATQEVQDSLVTAPPAPGAWDSLGEYYNHRAADGPRSSSRRCRASDH